MSPVTTSVLWVAAVPAGGRGDILSGCRDAAGDPVGAGLAEAGRVVSTLAICLTSPHSQSGNNNTYPGHAHRLALLALVLPLPGAPLPPPILSEGDRTLGLP